MADETPLDNKYLHPRSASEQFDNAGAEESHGISFNVESQAHDGRPPPPIKHM